MNGLKNVVLKAYFKTNLFRICIPTCNGIKEIKVNLAHNMVV
jgi:hypothetical protein